MRCNRNLTTTCGSRGGSDDGIRTEEVLVQREVVESLTGMTLDESKELA